MNAPGWIDFLRGVPSAYHSELTLVTMAGNEIAVQTVMHVADDYLVIRGRVTGRTESAGFFMIPLDRVAYVGFAKGIKEQEIAALFGVAGPADAGAARAAEEPTRVEPAAAAAEPGVNGPAAKPGPVDKSGLLERLRARRSLTDFPRVSGQ